MSIQIAKSEMMASDDDGGWGALNLPIETDWFEAVEAAKWSNSEKCSQLDLSFKINENMEFEDKYKSGEG